MLDQKIIMRCQSCGSADITIDASARWDVKTQDWELSDVNDVFYCNDCGDDHTDCDRAPYVEPAA